MIHVWVRHDDVTHGAALRVGESERETAGVNGDAVINDVAA